MVLQFDTKLNKPCIVDSVQKEWKKGYKNNQNNFTSSSSKLEIIQISSLLPLVVVPIKKLLHKSAREGIPDT